MRTAWVAALAALVAACGGTDESADVDSALAVAQRVEVDVDDVTGVIEITEDNDPNNLIGRPNGYEQAVVIYDRRVSCDEMGVACGATVEVFASAKGAQDRSAFIQSILEDAPTLGSEYHYLDGEVLLRVSGDLNPTDAQDYDAAFN